MPSDLTIQLTIQPTDSLPAEVLAKICRKARRAGKTPAEFIADVLRRAVRSSPRRTGGIHQTRQCRTNLQKQTP